MLHKLSWSALVASALNVATSAAAITTSTAQACVVVRGGKDGF